VRFASRPRIDEYIFVLFTRGCDEHNWRDFGETGVLRRAFPPSGVRGYLDTKARLSRFAVFDLKAAPLRQSGRPYRLCKNTAALGRTSRRCNH
jgi:hypothetical protein